MKTKWIAQRTGDASIMKASMQTLRERLVSNPKVGDKRLRSIGNEFGSEMAQKLDADSVDGVVRELASYWAENELGRIRWVDRKRRVIAIENYEEFSEEPADIHRSLCPFKKGYLEALLRARLGESFSVSELRSGPPKICIFRING